MTKLDWFSRQYGIFLGGLSQFVQPLVTLGSPLQTLTPSLLPHVPPPNPTRAPRVHKTAVNRSVTVVTGLTEPARLLKPTGNCPLTVPMKPSFSSNRSVWSVYRSGFAEFENRYCSGFVNPE
jgi:hypothetical protein